MKNRFRTFSTWLETLDERRALTAILITGLFLRLILVLYAAPHPERFIQEDAQEYDRLALNLAEGKGYSRAPTPPYLPDNFRVPLYPIMLGIIYALFGHAPRLILLLQTIFGTITIGIVYLLAREIFGRPAALIGTALMAVCFHAITYTALLWAETLYSLLLSTAALLIWKTWQQKSTQWAIAGGIVLGAATLTHPRSLFLPGLMVLFLIAAGIRNREGWRKLVRLATFFSISFAAALTPWLLRNYATFGVANLSSVTGINMLRYGAALTEASRTGENQWAIAARYDAQIATSVPHKLNEAEYAAYAFQMGIEKILSDIPAYLKVHLIGTMKIFLPGTFSINLLLTGQKADTSQIYSTFINGNGLMGTFSRLHPIVWLYIGTETLYLITVYGLALIGTIRKWRSVRTWFLLLHIAYLALLPGAAGAPRFRIALMPFLCILAAAALFESEKPHSVTRSLDDAAKNLNAAGRVG